MARSHHLSNTLAVSPAVCRLSPPRRNELDCRSVSPSALRHTVDMHSQRLQDHRGACATCKYPQASNTRALHRPRRPAPPSELP